MKKVHFAGILLVLFALIIGSCQEKKSAPALPKKPVIAFNKAAVNAFYVKFPKLVPYKKQVTALYHSKQFGFLWADKKQRKEAAKVMYDKIHQLQYEGIEVTAPYIEQFDKEFQADSTASSVHVELFLSNYYFLYTNKLFQGIDDSKSTELGWFIPRKKISYVAYLDSLLADPTILDKKERLISQYYSLKKVLKQYKDIETAGGWKKIRLPEDFKALKPGDSSAIVPHIRTRLFLTGDIAADSKSAYYDKALQRGVIKYKNRNGFTPDRTLLAKHIADMNVPVADRIKTIEVNMERCRWVDADITKAKEFIVVNIPAYHLTYYKDKSVALACNVVVGNTMNETVIFSGMMSYIVFSPYWNVPKSIVEKEITPELEKDKDYLEKHNMERYNGNIRQKPGPENSLGLVKFLFPNNNNIYLHDTPAKGLFTQEKRAFSHGCIRVEKPKELADLILENDPNWPPEKIDEAMNGGEEKWVTLTNKIPVYIGYLTAWVNDDGTINFYKDIYNRDTTLADILSKE